MCNKPKEGKEPSKRNKLNKLDKRNKRNQRDKPNKLNQSDKRNQRMVLISPPFILTFGCQPNNSLALDISGHLTLGSF